uniref:Uncharacterized protein n=1 Tax=Anguilla anguilla TaxID=7936 RepID=A0A0E9UU24_ANGAN
MADTGGPNGKGIEHDHMHMLMKFCVDRTYGVGVMAFYAKPFVIAPLSGRRTWFLVPE